MSDLRAVFESQLERMMQLGSLNDEREITPAAEPILQTKPRKSRAKPKRHATGKEIMREALEHSSSPGGDYADDSDEDDFLGDDAIPEVESPYYVYDKDKAQKLEITPKAFVEPASVSYDRDKVDLLLPPPGFVTDFINTSRGMEVPSLFMFWGALWSLSTVLARHAWIEWYPEPLWPNLYVIIVAPPGLCKKSTSLSIGRKLVELAPEMLPSNIEAFEKSIPIVTGKATSDGILGMLAPEERTYIVRENSSMRFVQRGSKVAFNVGELTTLINKQQYNMNLITTLTSLYDSLEKDSELTRARGKEPLKDIYVTFIGATTPSHLKTSMPEEALGGGFLSRVVVVYQDVPTKVYSMPRALPGYPTPVDLIEKLAWITHKCKGGYVLTPAAFELYDEQYKNWKNRIFASSISEVSGETRYDVILLKMAMLLRVQEYRRGNDITLDNMRCAIRMLDYTLNGSRAATEDIGMNDYTRWLNQFRRIIQKKGSANRSYIQRALSSKGCKVNEFDMIVSQLVAEDQITVHLNGKMHSQATRAGAEVYMLTGATLRELEKESSNAG
jgi:hypothetical protein